MPSTSGTQTVKRAIQLLRIFDDDHPQWSFADLVQATKLNKTTVFRLLTTLEDERLVRRTPSGRYRLGSEMIALGGRAMRSNNLRMVSNDTLRQLTQTTGETTTLEVLRQDRHGIWTTLVIDEVLGRHLVGITQYIGSRLPIHATSTGKVLLAYQSADRFDQFLQQPLSSLTEHTLITLSDLRHELKLVRKQGVAIAVGELEMGLMTTAAPIFDYSGGIQAAISIVGPSIRVNQDRLLELAKLAKESANTISHQLGFRQEDITTTM